MAFTPTAPWNVGDPTKKTFLDALLANDNYLLLNTQMIYNLKPVINAAVNKLDIFSKSGGADPDASNIVAVAIPDGNGFVFRSRAAAYLSGTSQIVMADAANYWGKGSLDAEIKTAWLYAIWDGTGIVWALAGYSGFTRVPTTTTATDDDYFLLEDGSTYARSNDHYCVSVAKIRYQYDTADTPDHTIQATVIDAPQVVWNPKSDYGYTKTLANSVNSGSDITEYSAVSVVVKQSGHYAITGHAMCYSTGAGAANTALQLSLRVGSATFGSATSIARAGSLAVPALNEGCGSITRSRYLNAGDTIHLGVGAVSSGGLRTIYGDDNFAGVTAVTFRRVD